VLVRRGERSGLFCFVAVHSTVRGPALGGCRLWAYADARAALRDVLRLSEGMTYKNAVAGLPLGGGKGVIMARPGEPLDQDLRADALRDFGDAVDAVRGAYVTAEDVGTSTRDMEHIAERTPHVSGLDSGSGDPSPWTALGVEASVLAACDEAFGAPDLDGRTVAVVGLGHVGLRLAELLAARGADLLVCDIDPAKAPLAGRLGARWITEQEALTAQVDVLCPCALGGTLDHGTVPHLGARVVAGAANNQLAEPGIADLLVARGITWAPDFVANAGGVVNIAQERTPTATTPLGPAPRSPRSGTPCGASSRRPRAAASRRCRPRWSSPAPAWPRAGRRAPRAVAPPGPRRYAAAARRGRTTSRPLPSPDRAPSCRATRVTRCPSTQQPFAERSSSRTQPPASCERMACRRETVGFSRRRSAEKDRPMRTMSPSSGMTLMSSPSSTAR
jgi:leucine dehydrogenase